MEWNSNWKSFVFKTANIDVKGDNFVHFFMSFVFHSFRFHFYLFIYLFIHLFITVTIQLKL